MDGKRQAHESPQLENEMSQLEIQDLNGQPNHFRDAAPSSCSGEASLPEIKASDTRKEEAVSPRETAKVVVGSGAKADQDIERPCPCCSQRSVEDLEFEEQAYPYGTNITLNHPSAVADLRSLSRGDEHSQPQSTRPHPPPVEESDLKDAQGRRRQDLADALYDYAATNPDMDVEASAHRYAEWASECQQPPKSQSQALSPLPPASSPTKNQETIESSKQPRSQRQETALPNIVEPSWREALSDDNERMKEQKIFDEGADPRSHCRPD